MNALRWFFTEYHHAWVDGTLCIVLTTDVPCHLYLFWTDKPMRIHNDPIIWRGIAMPSHPRYCFVEYNKVEQDEPGDTLLHHFSFPGWFYCEWRWWIFSGTVGGERSPSASPIMSAHYQTFLKDESMRHVDLTDKEVAGIIDHGDGSITGAKLRYPFSFAQFPTTPALAPTTDFEVANKKYVDDQAGGPAAWTLLVDKNLTGQASYTESWEGIYQAFMIMFTARRAGQSVKPAIRLNEDAANHYDNLFTFVRTAAGPTRVDLRSANRFVIGSILSGTGLAWSYVGHAMRAPSGQPGLMINFKASKDCTQASTEFNDGIHLYTPASEVNSITIINDAGPAFDVNLKVLGIPA